MARRDFTVNAIAKRLRTGELLDPLDGRGDLARRVLRTTSPTSFRDDPLRIVRGLRFVSELGFDLDPETERQMREWAPRLAHVSGERIGGGLASDGLGELSKLLLGSEPARALRLARDTDALVQILPELEPSIGFDQESRYHELPLDEHLFAVVQAASDDGATLRVRLAALFHDAGKPASAWRGKDGRLHFYAYPALGKLAHEEIGADLVSTALARLRYPTRVRLSVRRIVREHMFEVPERALPLRARRFLARHGEQTAFDLVAHKQADLKGKRLVETEQVRGELERLDRFRAALEAERKSAYRVEHLAIDGNDLIALGWEPSPALGRALDRLLQAVIGEPELNTRDRLLAEAERLLAHAG